MIFFRIDRRALASVVRLMVVTMLASASAEAAKPDRIAPTVAITAPTAGATYTTAQTVLVNVTATDNVGVTQVELYRNGVLLGTDTAAPYSFAWAITSANNGSQSLTARAYDARGNSSTSAAVSVTVNISTSVADTTPPTTSIASPTSGSTYTTAQTVTINASASDNVAVSRVEFYRGGSLQGTDTVAPYTYSWAVSSGNNGTHGWTSKAYDAANNSTWSSVVNLTVNIAASDTTPPTVSISSPSSGTTYTTAQTVTITATASDNVGVSRVEFYRGGVLQSTDTSAPFSHAWAISSAVNGTHAWTARAYDAANNSTLSSGASLTVNIAAADTTPPTVSISSPASGTTYTTAQTVTITATATDNVGVSRVEFYRGGVLQSTDTSAPFSHAWAISSTVNGTHSWTARAYDAANNNTLSSGASLTVNIATTTPGQHLWSRQFGGPTTADVAIGQLTSLDPWGGIFVVATVRGSVDFGAGPTTSSGGIVLSKFSADGSSTVWSRLWTGQAGAEFIPKGTVVNADGSIVVVGYFYGTIDFGGATHVGAGGYDTFMVKYSSAGQYLWSRRFGTTGSEAASAIAVDASGNLFVTGYVQGTANLGGSDLTSIGGSRDIFVAKYSSTGTHVWSRAFGAASTDEGLGIAADAAGNAWTTGSLQGTVDFGTGPLTSAGMSDVFVAKLSTSGTALQSWREGGASRDVGRRIVIDGLGNVVVAAHFEGLATLGGQALTSAGSVDVALLQYSPSGGWNWVRQLGGGYADTVNGLSVNDAGEVAITGTFVSWVDIGGTLHTGDGSTDVYIAKYTSAGTRLWSRDAGVAWDDYGNGIAVDDSGAVVATGSFYSGIDLGGGTMTTVTGSTDTFLVRYAP